MEIASEVSGLFVTAVQADKVIAEVASPSWLFVVAELRVSSRLEIPRKSRSQRGVEEGVLKLISSLEAKHMTIYLEWLFALGIAIRLIEPYSTLGENARYPSVICLT